MAPPKTRVVSRVSANAISFAELCLALAEGEFTRTELHKRIDINDQTLGRWLGYLKKRRLVYICEWRRTYRIGAPAAVWTWGYLQNDVKKPVKRPDKEYRKTYEDNKQLGVLYDISRPLQK